MSPIVGQILLECLAVPFGIACFIIGSTRLLLPKAHFVAAVAVGLTGAVLATYLLAFGPPAWLPVGAREKIFFVVLAGLVPALARNLRQSLALLLSAWPIAAVIWTGWTPLTEGRLETLAVPALLGSLLALMQQRPSNGEDRSGGETSIMLLSLALGLAGLALLAPSISLMELGIAAAAGLVAFRLLGPGACPATPLFGIAGMLAALATALGAFSGTSALALLLLAPIPLAGRLASRFEPGGNQPSRPLLFGLFCIVPLVLAQAAARLAPRLV